jgi:hypothetical protein
MKQEAAGTSVFIPKTFAAVQSYPGGLNFF